MSFSLGTAETAQNNSNDPTEQLVQLSLESKRSPLPPDSQKAIPGIRLVSTNTEPEKHLSTEGTSAEFTKKILVQEFIFEGNAAIESKELCKLLESDRGKPLSIEQIKAAAGKVEAYYHERGYIYAVVKVPEQAVESGKVKLVVYEGKLGEVTIIGNRRFSQNTIAKYFSKVRSQQAIRQDTIERSVRVLKSLPGLDILNPPQVKLKTGTAPGTIDVDVQVKEATDLLSYAVTLDNFGSMYASEERVAEECTFTNPTRRGDQAYLSVIHGIDPGDLLYGRLSYTTPIGADGLELSAYLLAGDFEVGREFKVLGIKGKGASAGIALRYPYRKSATQEITLEAGFDAKNARQELLQQVSSDDKIRSIRLGGTWSILRPASKGGRSKSKTILSAYIHQGLGELLGGMEDYENPSVSKSSRQFADDKFTKVTVQGAHVLFPSPRSSLIAKLAAQFSTDSLVVGEQMAIGGADSVRGYPQSEYLGDHGIMASAEWRYSLDQTKLPHWVEQFQTAVFLDYGQVWTKKPAVGISSSESLLGTGIGFRTALKGDFSLRFDLGYAIGQEPSDGERLRPYFQLSRTF